MLKKRTTSKESSGLLAENTLRMRSADFLAIDAKQAWQSEEFACVCPFAACQQDPFSASFFLLQFEFQDHFTGIPDFSGD